MEQFIYTQGLTDRQWYYARAQQEPIPVDEWTGPFMTRADAVSHSKRPSNHD
jgi:hypothetical protein